MALTYDDQIELERRRLTGAVKMQFRATNSDDWFRNDRTIARCLGYLEDLGENRTEAMDQAILMARADFGL